MDREARVLMPTVHITEVTVYADGADPTNYNDDMFKFVVRWCGEYRGKEGGGWGVFQRGSRDVMLSRSGKVEWGVPRFRRWQFRWENYDDALAAAVEHVNDVKVNGRTLTQWREFWREREEATT